MGKIDWGRLERENAQREEREADQRIDQGWPWLASD